MKLGCIGVTLSWFDPLIADGLATFEPSFGVIEVIFLISSILSSLQLVLLNQMKQKTPFKIN